MAATELEMNVQINRSALEGPLHALGSWCERKRVKTRLRSVESQLRRAETGHLSEKLRESRKANLDHLHAYWVAERFPINTEHPGKRVPYIRDTRGTLCAVAYLLEKSGEAELINDLAESDNHVRVRDVNGGPLIDWLEGSGLTQEEAACIQPTYDFGLAIVAVLAFFALLLEIFRFIFG